MPLLTWFWGVRKYDFMTPRTIPVRELRPDFASPVNREIVEAVTPYSLHPQEGKTPEIPEIPLGDLNASPQLDEYREQASLGAPSLLQLADRLQYEGRIQRAVLAYERVIDSTPSGGSAQEEATEALANLKESLPPWNGDLSASEPLQINLATARPPESLQHGITTLSSLVSVASGNLASARFEITQLPPPPASLPSLPVAMWLTVPGEEAAKPSLSVITIIPAEDEDLASELTHGLYRLIGRRLETIAQLTLPPPLLKGDEPENAIVNKLTRLAWQQILETPFQSLEAGPPTEKPSEDSPLPDEASEGEGAAEAEIETTPETLVENP
ncbi:hypothetical protein [Roseibacillus ishigakijimensis]|uniref:hypothetical protein n=1 Tax=Roseibacillus ishigakijimensis TaxID=454146 RepID=UPI001907D921|nr:hypothetical protein [Roseibacillus ishigakijimensis]